MSPGLVDPHSHLIFAGDRTAEYEEKILGRIVGPHLERGIGVTLRATRAASDEALVGQALRDLDLALAHGTTTLEAKTGYGLDRASEMRLLRLTAGLEHRGRGGADLPRRACGAGGPCRAPRGLCRAC